MSYMTLSADTIKVARAIVSAYEEGGKPTLVIDYEDGSGRQAVVKKREYRKLKRMLKQNDRSGIGHRRQT